METIEKSVEITNDLVQINNDRIAGYEHAIKNLDEKDIDLKAVFQEYKERSRENVQELSSAITQFGGDVETGTSASGAIHRAWLDVKGTFSGHDRKSILEECERGEDAIKKAYRDALSYDSGLSPDLKLLVSRQEEGIFNAHDKIKALRDSQR